MKRAEVPERILSIMSRKLRSSYEYIVDCMKKTGLEGLDISHGDIMDQLYRHGPMPMKVLAERIGRDKSTVTVLVRKMQQRGLVYTKSDPGDGRVSRVCLTEKGESYKDDFSAISASVMERIYKDFSESEKKTLISLLSRLGE